LADKFYFFGQRYLKA